MSVRRLAEENIQPEAFAFSAENEKWAKSKIREYPAGRQASAVIPLLFKAQLQDGWVSRAAIESVAERLDMPYIRVLEVATFYTQFQLQPVGSKAHVQVCGTTPCMLRGAEDLRAVCQKKIHADPHHLNDAGTLSWEEVECAGACVNAPMVTIGEDTYEDLTPQRLEEIIDAFEAGNGASVPVGPQIERKFSAAPGGQTTLTEVPPPPTPITPPKAPSGDTPAPASAKPAAEKSVAPAKSTTPRTNSERAQAAKPAPAEHAPPKKAPALPEGALYQAPDGPADDLKMISGVGPVIEKKLNTLGITTFAQVAAFKKADIDQVDDVLNFKGRIERDDWVKQANALAEGGAEEYRRVFGKDPR